MSVTHEKLSATSLNREWVWNWKDDLDGVAVIALDADGKSVLHPIVMSGLFQGLFESMRS